MFIIHNWQSGYYLYILSNPYYKRTELCIYMSIEFCEGVIIMTDVYMYVCCDSNDAYSDIYQDNMNSLITTKLYMYKLLCILIPPLPLER